jgi:hypothetical protein
VLLIRGTQFVKACGPFTNKSKEFQLRHRTIVKLGLAVATVAATVLPVALFAGPAFADYAPSGKDVVGVGSDTLQYMIDFLAQGDGYGDNGYNFLNNKYNLVSFDATTDANARLAYGVDGGQASQATCTPGTGSTAGTANSGSTNTGVPCVLNPTIVLRAGLQPVQRPNGSGAGFSALTQDIIAGNNSLTPTSAQEVVSFARSSSAQTNPTGLPSGEHIDQITLANDTLPMIRTTTPVSDATVALTAAQLDAIYTANTCPTWASLGATGPNSSDPVIPIIPQVGSGTRKYFLQQIGDAALTVGACPVVGEENDPTALAQTSNPRAAIEPISQGRLDLYQGVTFDGRSPLGAGVGYFLDPSCAYLSGTAACGSGSVSAGTWTTNSVTPLVQPIPGAFDPSRPLYIEVRSSDVTSTTPWQPNTTANWVTALFYGSSSSFVNTAAGQVDLEDAGVQPVTPSTCENLATSGACP